MRTAFLIFISWFFFAGISNGQQALVDSFRAIYQHAAHDSIRVSALANMGFYMQTYNPDSAYIFIREGIRLDGESLLKLTRELIDKAGELYGQVKKSDYAR